MSTASCCGRSGEGTPDLKVFVEPRDNGFTTAANGAPRFVPASAIDDWREQAAMAREAARKAEERAREEIAKANCPGATGEG